MNIIAAMDDPALFKPWFPGGTWNAWRAILKAAFGLPMSKAEITFFRSVADREPPGERVKELWIIAGRRAGKDSVASLIAAHAAALFEGNGELRPGERALVMCLATDRTQAQICLNYVKSYFTDVPLLADMIERETAYGFDLSNRIEVSVSTNTFRAVRGRPILCAVLDEIAFWRDDASANPDAEIYNAIRPATATMPGAMIVGISSPYRRSGLLHDKFKRNYGKPGNILVIRAPTTLLNPSIDPQIIADALAEDPAAARAEWLAEFRDDIAAFVSQDAVDACVSTEVLERSRVQGVKYQAFCDPSGGASDSMTLAIGHSSKLQEKSVAVLDAVREITAPFNPDNAVAEFAKLLADYGIRSIKGDRYAAEWVVQAFRKLNITYQTSELSKSEIYRDFLPRLNSGEVDLLDNRRLISQMLSLERRTARGGRDSIDHPPGGKDDLANAAAGVLVYLTSSHNQPAPMPLFGTYGRVDRNSIDPLSPEEAIKRGHLSRERAIREGII